MTKKIRIKLVPRMSLSEALNYFPDIRTKISEFESIRPDTTNDLTVHKRENIAVQLDLLLELAMEDIDAEGNTLSRFFESTKKFYNTLEERIKKHGRQPPRNNIFFGEWKKEEGKLEVLLEMGRVDLKTLTEQQEAYTQKVKALGVVGEYVLKIQKTVTDEINALTRFIEFSTSKR